MKHHTFDIVWNKLALWVTTAVAMLPNLVVAILVVFAFWGIAKLIGRFARGPLEHVSHNPQLPPLLISVAKLVLLVLGVMIALSVMKLDGTVTSLLAGVGILGIAIGFAFQEVASNFISGVVLSLKRPFEVGDEIELGTFKGTVERTTLRVTVARTSQGQLAFIPNKDVLHSIVKNHTVTGERRVDIEFGVARDEDLEAVEKCVLGAVEQVSERVADKPVKFLVTKLGDTAVTCQAKFWVTLKDHDPDVAQHDAIKRIQRALKENGIAAVDAQRARRVDSKDGEPKNARPAKPEGRVAS